MRRIYQDHAACKPRRIVCGSSEWNCELRDEIQKVCSFRGERDAAAANAELFSEQMGKALLPPDRNPMKIALESTGAIIEIRWQRSFYANLDAFLAMVRSVPEIIHACFGADLGSREMKAWFNGLTLAEQT